jgi:hypothetical protein
MTKPGGSPSTFAMKSPWSERVFRRGAFRVGGGSCNESEHRYQRERVEFFLHRAFRNSAHSFTADVPKLVIMVRCVTMKKKMKGDGDSIDPAAKVVNSFSCR